MVDYISARDAIAAILGTVAITTPIAASIQTVDVTPDAMAVEKAPAFVLVGYESRWLRAPGGTRRRIYTVGIRLIVRETTGAPMQEILEAFKEATGAAFDSKITLGLGGGYSVVEGPNWIQREPVYDGGSLWDEGEIIVELGDSATFGP